MNKQIILSFFFLPGLLFAQQISVAGNVKTNQNQDIPFASVVFKDNKATDNIKGVITDKKGAFEIKLDKGKYTVEITVVGMKPSTHALNLNKAQKKIDVGVYRIDTTVKLEEVVVTTEEDLIQILPDKKVYNVGKDQTVSGASITGVMENLPSVQVDNGLISIRGDKNVTLLVDGQPNGMTNNLETFPGNMVQRIEVITSPGAKYEARGAAGIINIILKKGKQYEYNSSTEIFSSYPLSIGINGNISQVGKKGNWYVNMGTGISQPISRNYITLKTPQEEIQKTKQKTERKRNQKYILVNSGKSHEFAENSQLNANITLRKATSDNNNEVNYDDQMSNGNILRSKRMEMEDENADMYQGSLSYSHKLGASSKINAVVNGEISRKNKRSEIESESYLMDDGNDYSNTTDKKETEKTYGLTLDYHTAINEKITLDMGYKLSFIKLGSDFKVAEIADNSATAVKDFTNIVYYTETIHAGYVELNINFEKESWTLGLRGEDTGIDINAVRGSLDQQKKYFNLFPSLRYVRQLSEKTRMQLALYRRIVRAPRSTRWILPYSTFTDNRNMFVGNTDINPSYMTGIEAELVMRISKKLRLYPALFYQLKKDELELYIEKRNIKVGDRELELYTSSLVNIGDFHAFGGEISFNYKPSKKWRFRGDILFNGYHQRGSYNGVNFSGDGLMISGKLITTYYISKTLDVQVRNYYDGPGRAGQYDMKGRYRMNMDIRKKIFKGKGRILLGMQDVFNTNYRRVETDAEDFNRFLELQSRVPQVNLSITYRFNQKKYKGKKGNQYDDYEVIN